MKNKNNSKNDLSNNCGIGGMQSSNINRKGSNHAYCHPTKAHLVTPYSKTTLINISSYSNKRLLTAN